MAVATHVLGPTLMPRFLMPRFYRCVTDRLAEGTVTYHAMPERGGLGRTDHVVDGFRVLAEQAEARREKIRLVGHSLGGIVVWVIAREYPHVIDTAELWCAPVRGTALAHVVVPVAESRFLSRTSRWLKRYDRPLNGVRIRAVYTALDQLAVPAPYTCYLEGDDVENYLVSPYPSAAGRLRPDEYLHRGVGEHVTLPRMASINRVLAQRDATRQPISSAAASSSPSAFSIPSTNGRASGTTARSAIAPRNISSR